MTSQVFMAEPTDAVDRAGITAVRGFTSLQPARQLILVVRRREWEVWMRYLGAILASAEAAGLLRVDPVAERLAALPAWVQRLQTPAGVRALELLLGDPVPAAVAEFWGCPALACRVEAGGEFLCLACPPEAVATEQGRGLRFAYSPHDGSELVAQLNAGDDPPVLCVNHYWDDDSAAFRFAERFSEWVGAYVVGTPLTGPQEMWF